MECPRCKTPTHPETFPGQPPAYVCPSCGWGKPEDPAAPEDTGPGATFYLKFALMWLLTPVILLGPYFGLRYLAAEFSDFADVDGFVAGLNIHYWWVLAFYLMVCWTLTPDYDHDNLGIFGRSLDSDYNPAVTREQHYNRAMLNLASFLLPGKIVLTTVGATFKLLFRR